jgi:hypothetical protein
MPYALRKVSSAGVVTTLSPPVVPTPPDQQSNWRVRAAIAGKDFFYNTSDWVYRLSVRRRRFARRAGSSLRASTTRTGDERALGLGRLSRRWLLRCAYRYLLGSMNSFGREILGPVSGRIT